MTGLRMVESGPSEISASSSPFDSLEDLLGSTETVLGSGDIIELPREDGPFCAARIIALNDDGE